MTPLVTENETEWLAVAHVRAYPHLPHACPICRESEAALNAGVALAAAIAKHPAGKGRQS